MQPPPPPPQWVSKQRPSDQKSSTLPLDTSKQCDIQSLFKLDTLSHPQHQMYPLWDLTKVIQLFFLFLFIFKCFKKAEIFLNNIFFKTKSTLGGGGGSRIYIVSREISISSTISGWKYSNSTYNVWLVSQIVLPLWKQEIQENHKKQFNFNCVLNELFHKIT